MPHSHELNPNNPAVRAAHSHWHAITAIIMHKHGLKEVEITPADVSVCEGKAVCIDERGGKCVIRLMSMDEAKKLAREHGGGFGAS